jgi:hypothetical protein
LRVFREEEPVGRQAAAAVMGGDGDLSGGDEVVEDLLDAAAAEAGVSLEGCLVGDPCAARVGKLGDGDEDDEVGAAFAGLLEDGVDVLVGHGLLSPPPPPAGCGPAGGGDGLRWI